VKQFGVRAAVWLAGLALSPTREYRPPSHSGMIPQLDQFQRAGKACAGESEYRQSDCGFAAGAEAAKKRGPIRARRGSDALAGSYLVLHSTVERWICMRSAGSGAAVRHRRSGAVVG